MATSRLSFTNDRLMKLPIPEKGRAYHYDTKAAGLCLCITHAGSRTLYYYKKVDRKPQRTRLGKFPDLSIDAARKAVAKKNGQIADGLDPAAEQRERRTESTLADLWLHWEQHTAERKKLRSRAEDKRQYDKFVAQWKKRRLSAITHADVAKLHRTIGDENGKYQANRVLALVRAMFNLAKKPAFGWKGDNPAGSIEPFKEQSRDRFLLPDELPGLFKAIYQEDDLFRDFFMLCLLTGARRSNVQGMRWEEIDLGLRFWRIPDTKGGDPVVVPLVEPAIRILQARLDASDGSPWVFATRSKTGHLVEPKTAWKRVVTRAGLPGVRMHDLRRTLGSYQAMGGSSLPIIGKSLGHKQAATTQIYARLEMTPVRESIEKATTAIYEAGKVKQLESNQGGDDAVVQE